MSEPPVKLLPIDSGTVPDPALKVQSEDQREAAGELDCSALDELPDPSHLVTRIAHEFNNVLTVIMGYADVALHKQLLCETAPEELVKIKKASERAAHLVREMLACSCSTCKQHDLK